MASLDTEARAAWRAAAYKNPDEIEHDIDDTRADLAATLEALEHKLSPEHLMDLTFGRVRQHGGELAGNLGSAVRDNPVPMLLTSIGIAWMMMSGRQHDGNALPREPRTGSRLRDRVRDASDRWTDAKDDAREHLEQSRESIAHAADSVRDGARRATDATRAQMQRARASADHLLHDQPLVLGAIGFAAGALIGAALPPTEEEDRLIGAARDGALDKAKRAGAEGYRKVRERAEDLAEQATTKPRERGADRDGSTPSARPDESSGERWDPAAASSTLASAGAAGAVPSSAWVAGTDNTANQSGEHGDDDDDDKGLARPIGENPSEPRQTKRRPSQRGVGREHSSDSFSTPDKSPTSKTPPL